MIPYLAVRTLAQHYWRGKRDEQHRGVLSMWNQTHFEIPVVPALMWRSIPEVRCLTRGGEVAFDIRCVFPERSP